MRCLRVSVQAGLTPDRLGPRPDRSSAALTCGPGCRAPQPAGGIHPAHSHPLTGEVERIIKVDRGLCGPRNSRKVTCAHRLSRGKKMVTLGSHGPNILRTILEKDVQVFRGAWWSLEVETRILFSDMMNS